MISAVVSFRVLGSTAVDTSAAGTGVIRLMLHIRTVGAGMICAVLGVSSLWPGVISAVVHFSSV